MQRLLISVRGPIEVIEAAKGGAHIAAWLCIKHTISVIQKKGYS